jgi:hypothetical protein
MLTVFSIESSVLVIYEIFPRPYFFDRCEGQVYLQQNKKKAEVESKNCHVKTMLGLEKPIKLI